MILGRREGNIATLGYNDETGRLWMSMPEGSGSGGFTLRYPAPSAAELVETARREGKIVQLKDPDTGGILTGFFSKGESGIYPDRIEPFMSHTDIKPGEFWSITERAGANGTTETSLFPY